jgi:hypothetical protein
MRFSTWSYAKTTVEIGAWPDVCNSFVGIYQVQGIEKGKCIECTIEKTSVSLSPLIASERSTFSVLQGGDDWDVSYNTTKYPALLTWGNLGLAAGLLFVQFVHGIYSHQYLNGTDSVEHVRVVTWCSAKASILILTRKNKVDCLLPRQSFGMAKKVKGSEPPIYAVESKVLRQPILKLIFPLSQSLKTYNRYLQGHAQCLIFECIRHVSQQQVPFHLARHGMRGHHLCQDLKREPSRGASF